MHASNLLKAALKPRSVSGSSSGQSLSTKDSKSRGSRTAAPDSGLSMSVTTNSGLSPIQKPAVKMSCLCAPTNHVGSFRCRLHRGNQQARDGRPVMAATPTASKSPAATAPAKPAASINSGSENVSSRRVVQHQLPASRPSVVPYALAHRISELPGRSRLSRVSAASDVEAPVAQASGPSPPPVPKTGNAAVRYLKFNPGAAASCGVNGAVLDGGMSFVKKLQTGGRDVMHEVFGSGTAMSRAALSL